MAALDNISTLAAAIFRAYLFIRLVRYGWKKRAARCARQFPKDFIESPLGMKVLMKVGTPTNSYTTCLHKFMTQMDDQTFFKVPRLLPLRI